MFIISCHTATLVFFFLILKSYVANKLHIFGPEQLGSSAMRRNNFYNFHTFNKCPNTELKYFGENINIT